MNIYDFANEVCSPPGQKGLIGCRPYGQTSDWQTLACGPNPACACVACRCRCSKPALGARRPAGASPSTPVSPSVPRTPLWGQLLPRGRYRGPPPRCGLCYQHLLGSEQPGTFLLPRVRRLHPSGGIWESLRQGVKLTKAVCLSASNLLTSPTTTPPHPCSSQCLAPTLEGDGVSSR